jgi:hypothetical protein
MIKEPGCDMGDQECACERPAADEQVPVTVTAVEIIDGVEVPIGKPRERTTSRGALDLLHGTAPELIDRRQRAREAGLDGIADPAKYTMTVAKAVEAAVESATRVRVDADLTQAVRDATPDLMITSRELKRLIEVAFRAAGFEVEK